MSGIPRPPVACNVSHGEPSYSEVHAVPIQVLIPVTHMQEFSRFYARIHGRFKLENGKLYQRTTSESPPGSPSPVLSGTERKPPSSHESSNRTSPKSGNKHQSKVAKQVEKEVEQVLTAPPFFAGRPAVAFEAGKTTFDLSSLENALPNASPPTSSDTTNSPGKVAVKPKRARGNAPKFQGKRKSHYRPLTLDELLRSPPNELQARQTVNYMIDNFYISDSTQQLDSTALARLANPCKWNQTHTVHNHGLRQEYSHLINGCGKIPKPLFRLLQVVALDHHIRCYDPYPLTDKFSFLGLVNAIKENSGPAYVAKHFQKYPSDDELFD